SLSTLKAGLDLKEKLLENQRNFYKDALIQADKYPVKGYLFSEPDDKGRVNEFIRILLAHQIKVYNTTRDITKNGTVYKAGESFIAPLKQSEYRFTRSLFETIKDFTDSLFYDTSTWTLPLAFDLNYTALNVQKEIDGLTGQELLTSPVPTGKLESPDDPYAYLFGWNEYFSPKALYALQDAGISARVSTEKFFYSDENLKKAFSYGTIMIPASGQPYSGKDLYEIMEKTASDCGITIYGVKTGLTVEGLDLGSSRIPVLKKPRVAMIVGEGINSNDAGEIWHLLDARFKIPVTLINSSRFGTTDLDRYNVIIIAGSPDISSSAVDNLKSWNRKGGTLIGFESGNNWISRNKLAEIEFVPEVPDKRRDGVYLNRNADTQAQQIPGSIFETKLDLTHPLCFGYTRETLPVFKATELVAKKDASIYSNPVKYSDTPLLSGYCTKGNIERIKGAPMVSIHGSRIISIYDDTNFRAYWYGTNKIFLNAIFFGQILR
ncbi:MAG: zinc carboxypeptidase, partial [Bacteroidota bacterium]|nr:zinc carboxypeptidase [Bacteroidota bacterium]